MHPRHASFTLGPRESQHRYSGEPLSCSTYNIIVQLSLPRVTETGAVRYRQTGNGTEDDHQAVIHQGYSGHIFGRKEKEIMGAAVVILPFGLAQYQSSKIGTRGMETKAGKKPHGGNSLPSWNAQRDRLSPPSPFPLIYCSLVIRIVTPLFLLLFSYFELHLARRSDTGFSDGGRGWGESTFGISGKGGRVGHWRSFFSVPPSWQGTQSVHGREGFRLLLLTLLRVLSCGSGLDEVAILCPVPIYPSMR